MNYSWAIVGAGPAGIAAVGKLIDTGIKPEEIAWIDPQFKVGDFGTLWKSVSSNTQVKLFLKFLENCQAFSINISEFELSKLNPHETCFLKEVTEPLQWITDHLRKRVISLKNYAQTLKIQNRSWNIQLDDSTIVKAQNVILAVGSEPLQLNHSKNIIPLEVALDEDQLKKHLHRNDVIGVFGSSHSAILILKNLFDNQNVKRVINFYRSPLRFAIPMNHEILYDNTGLKGIAADWARSHLHGTFPDILQRVYSNRENIKTYLNQCTQIIYAIGFQRRTLPNIHGLDRIEYDEHCGIIAPGLFGLGIAFPQLKTYSNGICEHAVGLWKFMQYLEEVLPIWLKYPI